ncbi:hypothetical protein M409DRAFT_58864 [Zasmidium cellare ATCC 36951]|uniref:Uncharacterized protein n=1 Tax=Zasmidium cellare ATCC 36951 TaxID=1080233 RepID=A0A6A6C6A9_ZASCE|nr:uncharacterized protein M409DRAFT_58864 [Zasmidium cellare ATCC 36951]KAF2161788.1 hypothetical protein M409DRAFT_58864 [Zasmidium cellare ATCC 36951]
MDSITRLSQKILAERARNGTQPNQTPSTAPPPYSESDMDSDDEDSDDESSPPVKLIVNAAHSIQGSGNLVPTSATPLADATKFSTLLLHAVNQINAVNNKSSTSATPTCRRPLKVDLTINCGVTVVGDRNVIGNVGLKPKAPNGVVAPALPATATAATTASTAAVAGAKRKSEEPDAGEEPAAKKVATTGDGGGN